MAIRKFVFCDICNQKGIRLVEERRGLERFREGRRIVDGRAWFEGNLDEAKKAGWDISQKKHTCPDCQKRVETGKPAKVSIPNPSQTETQVQTKSKPKAK